MFITSIAYDYYKAYVTAFIEVDGAPVTVFGKPPVKHIVRAVNIMCLIECFIYILTCILWMIQVWKFINIFFLLNFFFFFSPPFLFIPEFFPHEKIMLQAALFFKEFKIKISRGGRRDRLTKKPQKTKKTKKKTHSGRS